jgi:hypothetical protein
MSIHSVIAHMMGNEDTLADEFDAILNIRAMFGGLVLQGSGGGGGTGLTDESGNQLTDESGTELDDE